MRQMPLQTTSSPITAVYSAQNGILRMSEEDAQKLDLLYVSFGIIADGKITVEHLQCLHRLPELRRMNPHMRIVLAIGGGAERGWADCACTEAGVDRLVDSTMEILEKYGFDGVDVDWEYPAHDGSQRTMHTRLLQGFRRRFDACPDRAYTLSLACCTTTWYFDITELDRSVVYLDFINLMTYDVGFTSPRAIHHTCACAMPEGMAVAGSAEENIRLFLERGIPAEKLLIGAAFYSRQWKKVEDVNNGLYAPAGTESDYGPSYTDLVSDCIDKNGYRRFWDDQAKAPYLFNGDTFISYDDPQSIAVKCGLVHTYGLRGMMAWEYGCDQTHTLLDAMARGLKDRGEPLNTAACPDKQTITL